MSREGRKTIRAVLADNPERLDSFRPQAENANAHTPRGLGLLERSIQADGWIGAITVAADGETFDGSARLEVGAATGFEDAIVVESDGTKPIVHIRTDIPSATDPRARRLSVAANQIAAEGWRPDASVLAAWAETDVSIRELWTPEGWAGVLSRAGTEIIDAADLWKGMPEFEQPGVKTYKDLIIHFKTREDYEEFARLINQTLTPHTRATWYPERPEELVGQTNKGLVFTREP